MTRLRNWFRPCRRGLCLAGALGLLLASRPSSVSADDDPPADPAVPRAEIVQPEVVPRERLLQRALESLQGARMKLSEGQTGEPTQALQRQVLADLDALLKTPPQSSPSQNPQGGGGQQQNSPSQSSDPQQPRGSSRNQQQSSSSQQQRQQQQQAGAEQERSQAEDSEERTGSRRVGVPVPLSRRRMEVDVWGHLPDKVREQLLNSYGERIVPQYEELVRRYYESLAGSGKD